MPIAIKIFLLSSIIFFDKCSLFLLTKHFVSEMNVYVFEQSLRIIIKVLHIP